MVNSRLTLPPANRPPRGPDWGRVYRFSLLGTLIMLVWLLYPTVTCSWRSFVDTPLAEEDPLDQTVSVGEQDRERVTRGAGFVERFTDSVGACYRATPLTGQGTWKSRIFIGFLVLTIGSWLADRMIRSQRHRRQRELG
jgi:hypothetical protein